MTTDNTMFTIAEDISKGSLNMPIIYCLEESAFYGYRDGYWERLETTPLDRMIIDEYDGRKLGEKDRRINCRQFSVTTRRQILENLKPLVYKKLEVFNKSGFINFDQGEFDPMTNTLHPHMMSNYSTLRMPYEWDSSIELGDKKIEEVCPLWIKTLGEIFEGDKDKFNLLQEFFGYCLTRDVRHEKALLLLGESRTGKSTILETFQAVIGKHNYSSVPLEHIENPQYTPLLMNKMINFDTDCSSQAERYESSFRKITSGEDINCNPKYVSPYTFKPYLKLIMAANQFPRIKDQSSAFYKRLLLLPCDRVFEDHEQDIRLKDKLQKELFGVFMWAVEGLHRLNKRGGFEKKDFMTEAVEELRLESNPSEIFLKEFVEVDFTNHDGIVKSELYERYRQWSVQMNQQYALSAMRFSQCVYRMFSKHTPKKSQRPDGVRIWRNLKYKQNGTLPQENIAWTD